MADKKPLAWHAAINNWCKTTLDVGLRLPNDRAPVAHLSRFGVSMISALKDQQAILADLQAEGKLTEAQADQIIAIEELLTSVAAMGQEQPQGDDWENAHASWREASELSDEQWNVDINKMPRDAANVTVGRIPHIETIPSHILHLLETDGGSVTEFHDDGSSTIYDRSTHSGVVRRITQPKPVIDGRIHSETDPAI